MCERATVPAPLRPDDPLVWERTYPGCKDHLHVVRADLRGLLSHCPMADDVIQVASELGANAIVHSASGRNGTFTLRLQDFRGEYLYAEVEDQGSDWPGDFESAEQPHGLYIVREIADTCGVDRGDRIRSVWFTIDYPLGSLPLAGRQRAAVTGRRAPAGSEDTEMPEWGEYA
jgi:anti-sigma regulatory factor (Ser/Thr protein kinase)